MRTLIAAFSMATLPQLAMAQTIHEGPADYYPPAPGARDVLLWASIALAIGLLGLAVERWRGRRAAATAALAAPSASAAPMSPVDMKGVGMAATATTTDGYGADVYAEDVSATSQSKVENILGFTGGGVHKRIDENRELLELLQREASGFLASHSWVEGWLASNDEFFVALALNVPITEGRFLGQAQRRPGEFPRPWPGTR